jgi:hypothetical protein
LAKSLADRSVANEGSGFNGGTMRAPKTKRERERQVRDIQIAVNKEWRQILENARGVFTSAKLRTTLRRLETLRKRAGKTRPHPIRQPK